MTAKLTQRLQKLIAQAGLASRRQAEDWIVQGRVTLNGLPAQLGDQADPARDRICIDGKPLKMAEPLHYVLLNKPVGYVTTAQDPEGRATVLDLVREVPVRLFPVGRLDLNTEGLLLLTNDGLLAARLQHPRHGVTKVYRVKVRGQLDEQRRRQLEEGVRLDDGLTAPARIRRIRRSAHNSWFDLELHEGRNRQVRRMCEAVGLAVSHLQRVQLAFLELAELPVGHWRYLRATEVDQLRRLCGLFS
ncbi:pseudouridine synthase [Desulfuromonas thiophila]|uniref:Pseudouridine synthase n=1 Tax=Desulfuromonas thiophila TaxID=57664 RepID=A0A1G7D062_9BACT|nr:pseudouridine synthase [Desulfuromonas thiophila]SDE44115.1 ribosomal large subunit pseudouridine synthase B [Desulfuromonas thiophila]